MAQSGQGLVQNRHIGAKPQGHARRVGANHAAADDQDFGRIRAWHAAKQDTASPVGFLQRNGANLYRHPARHFAHWRQQRQAALGVGNGFIGDCRATGLLQQFGLGGVGRQVKKGEQNLALAQPFAFNRLGFLDLDDHLRGGENFLRRGGDPGANSLIGAVVATNAGAGAGFHQH